MDRPMQSGPDYYVEIDVVMDANTPLWKAHDLAQSLQDKIEVLPNVGRAFVHVDHETTHMPVSLLPCAPFSIFYFSSNLGAPPSFPLSLSLLTSPIIFFLFYS